MTAKRRRTKAEVDSERLVKADAALAMQAKENEINSLKDTLQSFGDKNPDLVNRMSFINDLMNNGMANVDQNGDYQIKKSLFQ